MGSGQTYGHPSAEVSGNSPTPAPVSPDSGTATQDTCREVSVFLVDLLPTMPARLPWRTGPRRCALQPAPAPADRSRRPCSPKPALACLWTPRSRKGLAASPDGTASAALEAPRSPAPGPSAPDVAPDAEAATCLPRLRALPRSAPRVDLPYSCRGGLPLSHALAKSLPLRELPDEGRRHGQ